jgi:hypothetical protein
MGKGVCLGCTERIVGCHSWCERYISEKEQREKAKSEMLKQKTENKAVGDILFRDVPKKGKNEIRYRIANKKKY